MTTDGGIAGSVTTVPFRILHSLKSASQPVDASGGHCLHMEATVDLEVLVDLYARASSCQAAGHATGTHAGIAAVLEALSNVAQRQAAAQIDRYDHRSLYSFAADMHYAARGGSAAGSSPCDGAV